MTTAFGCCPYAAAPFDFDFMVEAFVHRRWPDRRSSGCVALMGIASGDSSVCCGRQLRTIRLSGESCAAAAAQFEPLTTGSTGRECGLTIETKGCGNADDLPRSSAASMRQGAWMGAPVVGQQFC